MSVVAKVVGVGLGVLLIRLKMMMVQAALELVDPACFHPWQ